MNEAETRAELIDPALKAAGWGVVEASRVRREVIAPGRLEGSGRRAKAEIADYVLVYRNTKLAVIEAKRLDLLDTEGVGQAKHYAGKLQTRFAFSTNGSGIYQIDMHTGAEAHVSAWPSPEDVWARAFPLPNAWRDRFAAVPMVEKGTEWTVRYYQANAVERTLERIEEGDRRILLTLATGTGKTSIAFQIVWKLFEAKWNLSGEPTRRPRILFLADRNNLADQAFNDFSSFAAFEEDAFVRIKPDEIAKRRRVPKNGSVFFTIFQTFMSGRDANGEPAPNFGEYPKDFFDVVVIDECHRGGARDESTWRGILEYFAPALQIGLTATPKREINADTYAYFGEPAYVYSLKQGINDGYLTPFKVRQIATTLDDYVYTPDDEVLEGEVQEGRRYTEADFNRVIEIEARERHRVKLFMEMINQGEKTLVFCASQVHALAVRNLINQIKTSKDPLYCVRVTASDGKLGDQYLLKFRDNDKTIPTILTSSQKLSTGVDARNVRNIVLMRPIKSMIEFKQIIGRGTRLYDGKDYFTIYDFVKAYLHFNDPEWDGEPMGPEAPPEPRTRPDGVEEPGPAPMTAETTRMRGGRAKSRSSSPTARSASFSTSPRRHSGAPTGGRCRRRSSSRACSESCRVSSRTKTNCAGSGAAGHPQGPAARPLREGIRRSATRGDQQRDQRGEKRHFRRAGLRRLYSAADHAARTGRREPGRDRRELRRQAADFSRFRALAICQSGRVEELDQEKLGGLVALKYGSAHEAAAALGSVGAIRDSFVGFQRTCTRRERLTRKWLGSIKTAARSMRASTGNYNE